LAASAFFSAKPRSASAQTITGAWPPSSPVKRFTRSAHMRPSCLPTATEPVNEALRIAA
jgi:hypothetical protein